MRTREDEERILNTKITSQTLLAHINYFLPIRLSIKTFKYIKNYGWLYTFRKIEYKFFRRSMYASLAKCRLFSDEQLKEAGIPAGLVRNNVEEIPVDDLRVTAVIFDEGPETGVLETRGKCTGDRGKYGCIKKKQAPQLLPDDMEMHFSCDGGDLFRPAAREGAGFLFVFFHGVPFYESVQAWITYPTPRTVRIILKPKTSSILERR